jgi:hypothetical protein
MLPCRTAIAADHSTCIVFILFDISADAANDRLLFVGLRLDLLLGFAATAFSFLLWGFICLLDILCMLAFGCPA